MSPQVHPSHSKAAVQYTGNQVSEVTSGSLTCGVSISPLVQSEQASADAVSKYHSKLFSVVKSEIPETEVTPDDRNAFAVDPERKLRGRKKNLTPRKDVENIIKDLDPALCGPHCQHVPVHRIW